jgi:hypothetical protein
MTSLRESLACKCKFGKFEFWATSTGGGGKRRIAQYNAIGVDGAVLEDLGEDARVETLKAYLTESEWIELDNIRREAKTKTFVHPLFGVYEARLAECTYEATILEGVTASLTIIEDGDHTIQLAPVVVTIPAAASAARGAADAFSEGLDDLSDLDGFSDAFDLSVLDMTDALSSWDSILDLAEAATSTWEQMGAEFDKLSSAAEGFIDQLDAAYDSVADLATLGLEDLVYCTIATARECVDSVQNSLSGALQPFKVVSPVGLWEVARNLMGSDDEDTIAQLLALNPSVVDLDCLPSGLELQVPILL